MTGHAGFDQVVLLCCSCAGLRHDRLEDALRGTGANSPPQNQTPRKSGRPLIELLIGQRRGGNRLAERAINPAKQ